MNKKSVFLLLPMIFLYGALPCLNADMSSSSTDTKIAIQKKEKEKHTMPPAEKIITTPSGLQYVEMKEGTGVSPKTGQKVTVHYTGTFVSGEKFDSSVDRGQPFQFIIGVGQVIKGWDEGVSTMKVGGKRKLMIPYQLGYGERGYPGAIPPKADLRFDVELLNVE